MVIIIKSVRLYAAKKKCASAFSKQTGFTLLNVLVSLAVCLFLSGILSPILHLFLSGRTVNGGIDSREHHIAVQQIMNECKQAETVKPADGGRVLTCRKTGGEEVRFEIYHTMIRKRVNGKGHVPILHNAASLTADVKNGLILVGITSVTGKKKQTAIPVYSSLKGD
ncbi:competence type IV pilus minor pilin ComGF [Bacillus amyloliquefaciens]|uniref:competence type IV pilus minor pilin ComGF n=1 Tax=Bacillus amyloliquefaciens TaxID=1390 RepID=UPI001ED98C53|nr:competence type IV pilus minor pilin ComGF [Bacillus amyloliquefaciens]MDH3090733.1 competence type IV pilus minor pilin ComGF [Bacillus amyloliquefaciens]